MLTMVCVLCVCCPPSPPLPLSGGRRGRPGAFGVCTSREVPCVLDLRGTPYSTLEVPSLGFSF